MYLGLRERTGSLVDLEEKIARHRRGAGSREAAIRELYKSEILKPSASVSLNELSVPLPEVGETLTAPLHETLLSPLSTEEEQSTKEIQAKGAALISIQLQEKETLNVEWKTRGKPHLFQSASVALIDSATYTELAQSGRKVTPGAVKRHSKGSSRRGFLTYESPSGGSYCLVIMNPSDSPEKIDIRYRISATPKSQDDSK